MSGSPGCFSTPKSEFPKAPWGYDLIKRVLDVALSLGVLIFFSPLWIIISLAIRLTSPGPAIFRQSLAVGKNGRRMTVYKFRTMIQAKTDDAHREMITRFVKGDPLSYGMNDSAKRPVFKLENHPRITPLGRILRKMGLDEVPQFWNVLRGEISIVGPRPSVTYEYELYNDYQKLRLSVVPGITGLYQVTARSHVPLDLMVEIDLDYIKRRSICLDLQIMIRTVWVMLTGKGAY